MESWTWNLDGNKLTWHNYKQLFLLASSFTNYLLSFCKQLLRENLSIKNFFLYETIILYMLKYRVLDLSDWTCTSVMKTLRCFNTKSVALSIISVICIKQKNRIILHTYKPITLITIIKGYLCITGFYFIGTLIIIMLSSHT